MKSGPKCVAATIGLVHYSSPLLTNNIRLYDGPTVSLEYFGDHRTFLTSKIEPRTAKCAIDYGVVALTKVGQQLAAIAGAEPVAGFFDFLEAEWANAGISRQPTATQ
jgi:hypothetical protein